MDRPGLSGGQVPTDPASSVGIGSTGPGLHQLGGARILPGQRFWADIEAHHPGIDSLHLPRQVADDWKRRLATFSKTTRTPTGERVHVTVPRINYRECLTPVRAFYLEQDRAARSGRAAVEVLDRCVTAVPADGPAWIDQLSTLADQISTGPRPIADHHLDQLAAALELTQAAIANRTRWRCGRHRY